MQQKFLTVDEVVRTMRLTRQTVCKRLQEGELPGVKIGRAWRIPQIEFEAWLKRPYRHTKRPKPEHPPIPMTKESRDFLADEYPALFGTVSRMEKNKWNRKTT